jgi:mannose-6-phosphate isomerase-like protein (cupin superfamily)
MTTQGKVFKDRVSGETFTFSKTSAETGGELLEIRTDYRSNSTKPPLHFHPSQREHFEIIEGSMTVEINGKQRVYRAGEAFDIMEGTHHAMWNAGDVPTKVIWQIRPALNSQAFFETIWGLREDGKVGRSGNPSLLQIAVMMREYAREFRLVSPPPTVQTVLFALLAFIGSLLGYKARYEKYSR